MRFQKKTIYIYIKINCFVGFLNGSILFHLIQYLIIHINKLFKWLFEWKKKFTKIENRYDNFEIILCNII